MVIIANELLCGRFAYYLLVIIAFQVDFGKRIC
jgi:hypothetical protein